MLHRALYLGRFFGMSQAMESVHVMWTLESGHSTFLRKSTLRVSLMGSRVVMNEQRMIILSIEKKVKLDS